MPIAVFRSIVWFALSVLLLAGGCSRSRAIDSKKLPGTWRMSQEGADMIWIFSPDGNLRLQIQQKGWLQFLGPVVDVAGHWQLKGDRLTVELTETPATLALWGANWTGQTQTLRIARLTAEELVIADPDSDAELRFRRSLAPPKK